MSVHVKTSVNGEPREFLCEVQEPLLDVLRDRLQLTGTKEGCGTGDCGACSVVLDGRLVCSCLVLGVEAEGRQIDTVEGVAPAAGLHPVQQQLLEHAALQCGICTPGMIVATRAFLDDCAARGITPDEATTRAALASSANRSAGVPPEVLTNAPRPPNTLRLSGDR